MPSRIPVNDRPIPLFPHCVLPAGRLCRVSVPPVGAPTGVPTGAPALPCMPRPERP
jgi:hypothetical protein